MHSKFLRKSGLITARIARDFFVTDIGSKIPSVAEYAERFAASRGIVQNSLAFLQEKGAVTIKKEGVKGSTLTGIHPETLQLYTGWDALTGTMPIPLNVRLAGLATAIHYEMHALPVPSSFAYMSGAGKRMEYLSKRIYDFIVVSLSSANIYLKEFSILDEPIVLEGCVYSEMYHLYFANPEHTEICDGMRVAIDATCTDQYTITKRLCSGKDVAFVEMPYIGFTETMTKDVVDCLVYRQEPWLEECLHMSPHAIEMPGFSPHDLTTPAILIHKDNYGLKKMMDRYLTLESIAEKQRDVMEGREMVRFY